ncbi:transposase family protein [Streptomyces sp. NBC_01764]|uniref:helix-turn-helix domain-containing protein n=1 Tax=Streptomyces sp. NBC_01764 TaxID=2975935 RepID=UPI00225BA81D|nr:transposase family protein [Streptomyces sp. NBC_01764]MCX4404025.1 transposase family protein [Streptomyces sp. NBC_01764]
MGAGAKHRLVFIDRLLATLVHLRHATTHNVLACWFRVDRSTITRAVNEVRPLPESFTALVAQLESEIEALAKSSPLAAVRAARRPEVIAMQTAYWPAREARQDGDPEQAATAQGLDGGAARKLLARSGRWRPYRGG